MATRIRWQTLIVLALALGFARLEAAAPSARAMYTSALAREQAVRGAVERGDRLTRGQVLVVITAYERIMRRYPGSGYSDNALWQGAGLARLSFERFGDPRDRRTGIRLLREFRARYRTSSLMARAKALLAELEAMPADGPRRAAAARTDSVQRASRPVPESSSVPSPAFDGASRPATIKAIRSDILPGMVRIVVEVEREVLYREEQLPSPPRVFLDLAGTRPAPELVDAVLRFDQDLVRQVRVGRHPNDVTRVVLDFEDMTGYSVYPMYNPYRLVIDCERRDPSRPAEPPLAASTLAPAAPFALPDLDEPGFPGVDNPAAEPPAAVAPAPAAPAPAVLAPAAPAPAPAPAAAPGASVPSAAVPPPPPPAPTTPATLASVPAAVPRTDPEPLAAREPPTTPGAAPAAPSANLRGGFSLARQLGLGISRIVIDPGHGGHDPGASARGVTESELVLDIALRLEKRLQALPGVEVVLTRRTNVFVPLEERTAIANREGADLFLSIHANASRNQHARGIETYFLNFASSSDAAAVAARENSAAGGTMNNLPDIVRAIALSNKVDESRDFATYVQRSMVDRLKRHNRLVRDLGVKQAPFVVLIGASMPSVLAEISFVTNREEAQLLKSNTYRQRIADALLEGITRYQGALKRAPTVASRDAGVAAKQ